MRACDVCRKKKQQCVTPSGSRSCFTCQAAGLPACTFLQSPPPKWRATTRDECMEDLALELLQRTVRPSQPQQPTPAPLKNLITQRNQCSQRLWALKRASSRSHLRTGCLLVVLRNRFITARENQRSCSSQGRSPCHPRCHA